MKEIIEEVDRLLAALLVRGDSVIVLAQARMALTKAYELAAEWEKLPAAGEEKK